METSSCAGGNITRQPIASMPLQAWMDGRAVVPGLPLPTDGVASMQPCMLVRGCVCVCNLRHVRVLLPAPLRGSISPTAIPTLCRPLPPPPPLPRCYLFACCRRFVGGLWPMPAWVWRDFRSLFFSPAFFLAVLFPPLPY